MTYHKAQKNHVAWEYEIEWKHGKDHPWHIDPRISHRLSLKLLQSPDQSDMTPQDVRLHQWKLAARVGCSFPTAPSSLSLSVLSLLAPFQFGLPNQLQFKIKS